MCFQVTCDNCRKKTWKGKQAVFLLYTSNRREVWEGGDHLELAVGFLGEWAA